MKVRMELLDRATGSAISDLSTATVTRFVRKRSKPDEMEFSLDPYDPRFKKIRLGDTEVSLYLADQTDPVFVGPIWTDTDNGQGPVIFTAEDPESYFGDRYIESSLSFEGVDQFQIAWSLIQHTQAQTNGDLRIDADFTSSGVSRDRHYHLDEHPNIGSLLNAFRGLSNGFDWKWRYFSDGRREWTPHYPKIGSVKPHMRAEYGKNIHSYTRRRDGRMINDAIATGDGEGPERVEGRYTDTERRAAVGLRSVVFSAGLDISNESTAVERAQARVEQNAHPVALVDVTVKQTDKYDILELEPGDEIPVKISRGGVRVRGMFLVDEISIDPYQETAKLDVEQRLEIPVGGYTALYEEEY